MNKMKTLNNRSWMRTADGRITGKQIKESLATAFQYRDVIRFNGRAARWLFVLNRHLTIEDCNRIARP